MPTKPAIPAQIKRHIAAEAGSRECEVVELLRGCYGSVDYTVSSYGYTAEYVQSVVDSISEMVTYINDEYDISLQEGDIIDVMLEFADLHREAWTDLIA